MIKTIIHFEDHDTGEQKVQEINSKSIAVVGVTDRGEQTEVNQCVIGAMNGIEVMSMVKSLKGLIEHVLGDLEPAQRSALLLSLMMEEVSDELAK